MRTKSLLLIIIFIIALLPFNEDSAEGLPSWLSDKFIGSKAPDFTLNDISGNTITLSSLKGRPVLLNFWATWCTYCRKEREHLNDLHKEYNGKGLVIISVSIDRSLDILKRFVRKVPSDFRILWDEKTRVASAYNVAGLPTSFLIDKNGIVIKKYTGLRDWTNDRSRRTIENLIHN